MSKHNLDDLLGLSKRIEISDEISELGTQPAPYQKTDFVKLKQEASETAGKLISNIVKFYFDTDQITRKEYIEYKQKIDVRVMGGFMFQMDMAEVACIKLLELIDEGNASFKHFESLAKIMETLANITKYHVDYMFLIEAGWKKTRVEHEELKMLAGKNNPENDNSNKNLKIKGTKMLIDVVNDVNKEMGLSNPNTEAVKIDARLLTPIEEIKQEENPNHNINEMFE